MLAPVTFLASVPTMAGHNHLERPDPDSEDQIGLDLSFDLGQVLPAALEVAFHVVLNDDLVGGGVPEAFERFLVLVHPGAQQDGYPRRGRRVRQPGEQQDDRQPKPTPTHPTPTLRTGDGCCQGRTATRAA
jgi:hypothetical protein